MIYLTTQRTMKESYHGESFNICMNFYTNMQPNSLTGEVSADLNEEVDVEDAKERPEYCLEIFSFKS